MARILVTGGTGTLGRSVVTRLRNAGSKVRVLSRPGHQAADGIEFVTGDLAGGEGVQAAVDGADVVVHCAGTSKGDDDKARSLVHAASRAGVGHLVFISVVGADRIPIVTGDGEQIEAVLVRQDHEPGRVGRPGNIRAVPGTQADAEPNLAIWHEILLVLKVSRSGQWKP
jgi:uncharacterized protein YbjT (DUF2867 family)